MLIDEWLTLIGLSLSGLVLVSAKKQSPFAKFCLVNLLLSIFIFIEKSALLSMLFFLSFLPMIFLAKKIPHLLKKREFSTIGQKVMGYLGVLPIFGMVVLFSSEIETLLLSWKFNENVLYFLEIALIVMTFYWTFEWTMNLKGFKKWF